MLEYPTPGLQYYFEITYVYLLGEIINDSKVLSSLFYFSYLFPYEMGHVVSA